MKRVVVLGSGRSATSLVAKGLHEAGVDMGTDIGAGPSNPAGHFEDRDLVRLNDRILRRARGTWFDPPSPGAVEALAGRVRPLVAVYLSGREHEDDPESPWGMKDPRLCLTWPAWWPLLAELAELVLVPVWRSPVEIARSFVAREGRPGPRTEDRPDAPPTWEDLAGIYQDGMVDALRRARR